MIIIFPLRHLLVGLCLEITTGREEITPRAW